jgi:hypothetical protein
VSLYAHGSSVPVDRSRSEIERTLTRYGAEKFGYFTSKDGAAIAFQVRGRAVRMRLALPDPDGFLRTDRGKARTTEAARREYEAELRRRWRCLALVVKAKLEAIETGIATFEDEWLAYFVLADGRTVGEQLAPQLDDARSRGAPLMLGMDAPRTDAT